MTGNDVFHFQKVFCVFVSVYVLRLWRGSGWQLRMWFRLDMQGNSKKSWKRTLLQKILWYWVCPSCQRDLVCGGRGKDCHERKWGKSHAGCRMSQVVWVRSDLVLQDSDLCGKNQMIQHLSGALCTHPSINTPIISSSPRAGCFSGELDSLGCLTQKWLNSPDLAEIFFSSNLFGFCSTLGVWARIFLQWKKKASIS